MCCILKNRHLVGPLLCETACCVKRVLAIVEASVRLCVCLVWESLQRSLAPYSWTKEGLRPSRERGSNGRRSPKQKNTNTLLRNRYLEISVDDESAVHVFKTEYDLGAVEADLSL